MNSAGSESRQLRVIVNIPQFGKAGRDRVSGIHRFASTHSQWDMFTMGEHSDNASLEDFAGIHVDGLITTPQFLEQEEIVAALHPRAIAIANGYNLRQPSFCRHFGAIVCDNYEIGCAGARFFVGKKFRHFAFVGMLKMQNWSIDRMNGFVDELARHGHECRIFKQSTELALGMERRHLAEFIVSMPKPCAIMAAVDSRAKHVIDCCRLNGILVPDQVSVLGVDNDEIICEWTRPSLSSIQPEFEESGYRLAMMLNALMTEAKPSSRMEKYGITGIVERLSTADTCGAIRLVTTAQDFIRRHASADISLADIAAHCGCSERTLQNKFRRVVGSSPIEKLIDRRLTLAADILLRTEIPVDQIGDFCGFKTTSNLKAAFKKRYGCSLREWRNRNRA